MNYKLQLLIRHYQKKFLVSRDVAEGLIAKSIKHYLSDDDVLMVAYIK